MENWRKLSQNYCQILLLNKYPGVCFCKHWISHWPRFESCQLNIILHCLYRWQRPWSACASTLCDHTRHNPMWSFWSYNIITEHQPCHYSSNNVFSLRKHANSNIWKISPPKTESFQIKILIFFLFLLKNIDCGYSLEPPRRGSSNKYPQSMFSSRN